MPTWRDRAARVIADVVGNDDPRRMNAAELKDLRRRLRDAYPWIRQGWAYKVWLDQVRRTLFIRPPPSSRDPDDPHQMLLFQ